MGPEKSGRMSPLPLCPSLRIGCSPFGSVLRWAPLLPGTCPFSQGPGSVRGLPLWDLPPTSELSPRGCGTRPGKPYLHADRQGGSSASLCEGRWVTSVKAPRQPPGIGEKLLHCRAVYFLDPREPTGTRTGKEPGRYRRLSTK